jgi:AcrR family transcriptional regulator
MAQSSKYERDEVSRAETPHRILEAAGQIFAASGYRYTTIRAISKLADVNVAAVSYHFGGKKNLYLAVIRSLRARVLAAHPFDLTDLTTQPPAERLHRFIHTFLSRMFDKDAGERFTKIMAQELIQPTAAFDEIMAEVINPVAAFLFAPVRQLFGKPLSDERTGLLCLSIVGQLFHFYMARPVTRKLFDKEGFDGRDIDMVATHVTRFSLYAIDRMAAEHEGE